VGFAKLRLRRYERRMRATPMLFVLITQTAFGGPVKDVAR
jgi:hypothetical protein